MDVPYLLHVPDGDELWLVDGEQRMLITPRIYDLLASNGADLPPAYGIEELREQNAKLREFATETWELLTCNEPNFVWSGLQEKACELGIEVD